MRFREWKWLMGPDPLPRFLLVLMPASMYRPAEPTALGKLNPLAMLQAMAAVISVSQMYLRNTSSQQYSQAREQPVPWVLREIWYSDSKVEKVPSSLYSTLTSMFFSSSASAAL